MKLTVGKLRRFDKRTRVLLAAVIEHAGTFRNMEVYLRSRGPLPKMLHEVFGGNYRWYAPYKGCPRAGEFRLRGRKAARLLERLAPYFLWRRGEARKLLERYRRRILGNPPPRRPHRS